IGQPLRFPPGVAGGQFDGAGTLWLLVASEGTVVGIRPAAVHASQGNASTPTRARTIAVAPPDHDLTMSTLGNGVAVLDSTATTMTLVQGEKCKTLRAPVRQRAELQQCPGRRRPGPGEGRRQARQQHPGPGSAAEPATSAAAEAADTRAAERADERHRDRGQRLGTPDVDGGPRE